VSAGWYEQLLQHGEVAALKYVLQQQLCDVGERGRADSAPDVVNDGTQEVS
jgi:hypothetical protein